MEPVPKFATEQEEAEWWDAHPHALTQRFAAAKQEGGLRRLSQTNLPGAGTSIIRIPATELVRLRQLAAKRGLDCQEYVEKLLHEALDNEEKLLLSA
jgi:predicted DNA binding CopG/RHH family protein